MTALKVLTWNANGLINKRNELELFLQTNSIDIALITETHFTSWSYLRIHNYKLYECPHPSNRARGGSAVLIRDHIKHDNFTRIQKEEYQVTAISIEFNHQKLVVAATYCPPRHRLLMESYVELFKQLGDRFILGGDFNAKHTLWGSRLTTAKGKELSKAITAIQAEVASSREPTYWPTDTSKRPDLLDFFILRKIPPIFTSAENINDLSSDHSPVLLTMSAHIMHRKVNLGLHNRRTNWETYREIINASVKLRSKIRTTSDLDHAVREFTSILQEAAKTATPSMPETQPVVTYPAEIRAMVAEKRRARKLWQNTGAARDKTKLN